MSFEAESLVWEHSRAQGDTRLVLALLAFRANRDHRGISWSKVDSLMERTRLPERTLQRAVARAIDLGELYVHVVHGRGRMNAYMVTCGRTRLFVVDALVEILGLPHNVAMRIAEKVPAVTGIRTGKGVTSDTLSDPEKVTSETPIPAIKGDTAGTYSTEKVPAVTGIPGAKTRQTGSEKVPDPAGKGVTRVVPPLHPPMMKNHEEEPVRETSRRRHARMSGPAGAPARIDDDDDFFELVLVEFESRTGRTRKPADELAARSLRGTNLESVRRGIAKSVAAVGDGRVSSLRYCVPAIEEAERLRARASVGAAPRPVAVPDPDIDVADELERPASEYSKSDKEPVWAEVKKFLARSASMHGRVPGHGEIRSHLILECGHDPGLVEAMYPTGNGSSASSRGQVLTTAEAVKE